MTTFHEREKANKGNRFEWIQHAEQYRLDLDVIFADTRTCRKAKSNRERERNDLWNRYRIRSERTRETIDQLNAGRDVHRACCSVSNER